MYSAIYVTYSMPSRAASPLVHVLLARKHVRLKTPMAARPKAKAKLSQSCVGG